MTLTTHYMKLGALAAYCLAPSKRVAVSFDDWSKVTCSGCLAHSSAPRNQAASADVTESRPQHRGRKAGGRRDSSR